MSQTITTQAELDDLFAGVGQSLAAADWRPYLQVELDTMRASTAQGFASEQAPDGSKWAPLAPSTVKRKGFDTILVETDRLRRSVAGETGDSIAEIDQFENMWAVTFGSEVPYGVEHLTGRDNMPARVWLGLTAATLDKSVDRALDFAMAVLREGA